MSTYYFGFESLLAHHEKGLIDPDLWQNFLENDTQLLGSPLGREYLASRRGSISRRLEAVVNQHLSAGAPSNTSLQSDWEPSGIDVEPRQSLLAMAEQRWRRINGAHLIPLVRAGVLFSDGVQAVGRHAA